eukprot:scaffold208_cov63-Attheya_sp.AAC.6
MANKQRTNWISLFYGLPLLIPTPTLELIQLARAIAGHGGRFRVAVGYVLVAGGRSSVGCLCMSQRY